MRFNIKERFSSDKQNSQKCSLEKKPPGIISRIFFCWILRLFYYGNCRNLDEHDLVPPKKIFNAKHLGNLLERNWLQEETAAKTAGHKGSLIKVIFKTFFCAFVPTMIMQFLYVFLRTTTPLLFGQLLQYWSPSSPIDRVTAMYYAGGMILGNLAAAFFYNHGLFSSFQCAMKIKVAISALIFRKILRMNKTSLEESKAGKIVNMLSNDLQRFDTTLLSVNYIWIIPLQAIGVCYFGYLQAGYAVLIGLAASVLISFPLQLSFSSIIGKSRSRAAKKTDERVQLMNEVITGIQVIKMYAWEIPFKNLVQSKRDEELNELGTATYIKSTILGFVGFAEKASLFVTILSFVLLGNPMSANVIFPLQQFMSALQIGLTFYLPMIVTSIAEMRVSINRLQDVLSLDDRPDLAPAEALASALFRYKNTKTEDKNVTPLSYHNTDSIISKGLTRQNTLRRNLSFPNDVAVAVREVSASWPGDSSEMVLRNISLQLQKGKLCAIIGVVGSGKSSLLQLLLKELPALSGSVTINGSISYASQDAWLFASSVRENIIFGQPYDVHKYREICKACALENDFLQFPHGDQSLVGERGVTLSGGQRARINLARALYREADIYILDDPLSAVDANVGRQLFDGCINGYLCGRTRVLVTHQIHFLQAADQIIVLNDGRAESVGTFDELVSSSKEFTMLLATLQEDNNADINKLMEKPDLLTNSGTLTRQLSQRIGVPLEEFKIQKIQEEERQHGNLKWEVIKAYFRSGGKMCAVTLLMVFLVACCGASADFWISYWSNQMANYEKGLHGAKMDTSLELRVGHFTTGQYLIIHGCIIATCIVMTQLRVMSVVSLCMSASRKLHNLMFSTVIAGIMRFFDTNLSGRILNRFTKDIGELDESVPRTLWLVFQLYSTVLAMLALNVIALYWTLIPSAFLLLICYFSVKIYMKGAQAVKRLEGTTKSPVFGMITSSLNGIATIRSAGAQQRLIDEFDISQDINTTAYNCYLGGASTLGLYLDILCIIYLTCVVFIFLFIDIESIDVGNVGLVITQGYTMGAYLQHGARNMVELLAQLTSVERVLEYTRIDTEDDLFQGKIKPPQDWPSAGTIEFRGVYLRYDAAEAPVLKDLNFVIQSGWKERIVGRTGAGKSSLISALFRLSDIEGTIAIDGLDTSVVSRQELRSKITIIPQAPVLFPATIRYNLDPLNIYSDEQLWRALEQVELKSAISSLDFKVTEGGYNFSVGQRQLLCLARAILRSNKILIMDEATANVDPQTDHFIQQTIRRLFSSCTVLTIAHRLNTVMDSDRVLVMGNGRLLEFDHPHVLLSDPHSRLSAMARETGDNIMSQLHNMAKQNFRKSKPHTIV